MSQVRIIKQPHQQMRKTIRNNLRICQIQNPKWGKIALEERKFALTNDKTVESLIESNQIIIAKQRLINSQIFIIN